MARMPYADLDAGHVKPVADAIRAQRAGNVPFLFQALLHNPAVAQAWIGFTTAIRRDTDLDGRTREIVILYAAMLSRAEYPINDHVPIALKEGMAQDEIDALLRDDLSSFDARDRALAAFVRASTLDVQVPDDVFADLGRHYSVRQVVEITVLTAAYNMVVRVLEPLQLDLEP